jgi:transcriptional regulator with XRE-family HTH domain
MEFMQNETREVMYKRIRALRKREHYTQYDMAEMLGISRRTYANYERGIHAMPVEALIVIADLFGTSLDYLTGRTRQEGFPQ